MTTNKMQSVYEIASNVITNNAKGIAKANKEAMSLNKVCKVMQSKEVYPHLAAALAQVGINSREEMTLKNVKTLIASELTKEETIKDKETKSEKKVQVICTIRKKYESEEVQLFNKEGKPIWDAKNNKARTAKVCKLDEEGERIIKEYTLCKVSAWNIALVLTLLAQSKAIKEGVE